MFRWLILSGCLWVAQFSAAEGVAMSAPKAQSPLQVTIHPVAEPVQGQTVEYVLQVWSAIDLAGVQVQIKIPPTARIEQGQADSQVDLTAYQVYLQSVTLYLPNTPDSAVQVFVTHDQGQGVRFSAADQYPAAPPSALAVTAGLSDGAPHERRRGAQRIKEFRVR